MAPTPTPPRAEARLSEIFEREVAVFLVATGTAANALALAALARPWQAMFCHEEAHIIDDECGAPEFFTAGAKLVGIPGRNGKITPDALSETLARFPRGLVKTTQPGALSLSQATEAGTVYSLDEIAALAAIAHEAGVGVHMDGARFANALVALGATPAEMTWRAGVDVLSFGATKNGALACEAVMFFDRDKAAAMPYQRKRAGRRCRKGASSARRWRPISTTACGSTWRGAPTPRPSASPRGSPPRPGVRLGLADRGQRGFRRRARRNARRLARRGRQISRLDDARGRSRTRAAGRRDHGAAGRLVRDQRARDRGAARARPRAKPKPQFLERLRAGVRWPNGSWSR